LATARAALDDWPQGADGPVGHLDRIVQYALEMDNEPRRGR
jgi:hypothetical protein